MGFSYCEGSGAPYTILKKIRKGDREVEISIPQIEKCLDFQPVLVDDIISSGQTMIETIKQLAKLHMKPPICLCVHPVFAEKSFEDIQSAGAKAVFSCNTIEHPSNISDISQLILQAWIEMTK